MPDNKMSFYRPEWGSDGTTLNFGLKQKFRWFFNIDQITGGSKTALPCIRASRPKLQFRPMQAEHLNETITYPAKPDWQPIQLTLYDRCLPVEHPVMTWLKTQYNPTPAKCSSWYPCIDSLTLKPCATLELYDGCGQVVEAWAFEHVYPESIDFGELNMEEVAIVTAEITLRYDRAWQYQAANGSVNAINHSLYSTGICTQCPTPTCAGSSDDSGSTGGSGGSDNGSQNSPTNPNQAFVAEPDFIML